MPSMRVIACGGLSLALALFGLDLLWALFFHGINIQLGWIKIRSTTIEFPVIALLCTGVGLLLLQKRWKETLLLCCSLLGACIICEGLLRIVDHPLSKPHVDYVAWYEPSDFLGHQLVKNFEGFGPLNVPIKINSRGNRDEEHLWEKNKATVRILGLGDSFLFGWGVPFEQTFLKQLEKLLQQAIGQRVETINTGVPGWGLNHYYLYLKKIGIQYSPDLIVLAYFTDDLSPSMQEAIPAQEQYAKGLQYKGGLMHHSRFYNFAKFLSDQIRYKNRATRIEYLHSLDSRRQEWSDRSLYLMSSERRDGDQQYIDLLNDYLGRIKRIADQIGAPVVLMYIPDLAQLNHPEVQYINRLLTKLTREQDIPFVDMTPVFERTADLSVFYLWPLDGHTNARGHLEMAKALMRPVCVALRSKNLRCADPLPASLSASTSGWKG